MAEFDKLLHDFQIPPGALTPEELRLLQQGGIKIDDDEQDLDHINFNRQTQPKNHYSKHSPPSDLEAFKLVYEN